MDGGGWPVIRLGYRERGGGGAGVFLCFCRLQASEQTVISGQARAHFFRQAKGRWQTAQSLVGR